MARPKTVLHWRLLAPGIKIAASTVWQILKDAGIDPTHEHASTTWPAFLSSQADALPACDFFETTTLSGTRLYVFAVVEHANRRTGILGATAHPTTSWITPAARNLVMDFEDEGRHVRFLIRDRTGRSLEPPGEKSPTDCSSSTNTTCEQC
ncbi:hypothetical protein [Saccharothrix syringae]|uniref:hypothetical protein n=1 Tax=Saccharothrix syringae TaxID=103733 RepID=UPI00068DD614|nr:hypothetical protein [Saccharothrix syringae]